MQWFFRRWRLWVAVLLACGGLGAGLGLPLVHALLEATHDERQRDAGVSDEAFPE